MSCQDTKLPRWHYNSSFQCARPLLSGEKQTTQCAQWEMGEQNGGQKGEYYTLCHPLHWPLAHRHDLTLLWIKHVADPFQAGTMQWSAYKRPCSLEGDCSLKRPTSNTETAMMSSRHQIRVKIWKYHLSANLPVPIIWWSTHWSSVYHNSERKKK